MDLLSHEEIASVSLLSLKVSEGELMAWEGCVDYVMRNCTDIEIEQLTGCKDHNELRILVVELQSLLKTYVNRKYWLDNLKKRL